METLKIKSPYFDKNMEYLKYLNSLDFVENSNIVEQFNFIEKNNLELFKNVSKYRNFLVYGDVQSGKTNNLIYITQKFVNDFGYNFILYLSGTKNNLMFQNQNRFYHSFADMNRDKYVVVNSSGQTKNNQRFLRTSIEKQNTIIMHSLKIPNSLEKLYDSLKIFKEKIKILIIDDEADEASLSKKTKKSIGSFFEFNETKKIAITASPFKNLYFNDDDYDYFYKLKSPEEYTGIEKFEKENYIVFKKNENNLLNFIIKPTIDWMSSIIVNKLKKSQLLVNVFNETEKHEKIYDYMSSIVLKLTSTRNAKKIMDKLKINVDYKKISDLAKKVINNINISNSTTEDKEWEDYQIIIGGLKLSRGLTYKYLTHEVMINMGGKINAGTLIQRARWLGYRKNMIKIMRIYITEEIREAFDELKDLILWTRKYQLVHKDYKKQFNDREYERIQL